MFGRMNDREKRPAVSKSRILVVDDHAIVRQGLTKLVNQESDLAVTAEAENARQALDAIEQQQIDLAIVDISLEGTSGLELAESISTGYPGLPVLILSMHDELSYCRRAFQAGARGFAIKSEVAEEIIKAIHKVLDGKSYISEKMAAKMKHTGISDMRDLFNLSGENASDPVRGAGGGHGS